MRKIVKILPCARVTARLSCNTANNNRRYSSVQVLPVSCGKMKIISKNEENFSFPITFTGLICNSYRSYKLLLSSWNWGKINESYIKNCISSIFLVSSKYMKQSKKFKCEDERISKFWKDLEFGLRDFNTAEVLSKTANQILSISGFHLHLLKRDFNIIITIKPISIGLTNFTKMYSPNINLREVSCHKNIQFFDNMGYLKNSFPMIPSKIYFSTTATNWRQSDISGNKLGLKCDPNYDFPHLSKIFGTDNLLMRSDAYSQAIIEAAKRRADLENDKTASKRIKNFVVSRPQVINIKGCTIPKPSFQYAKKPEIKSYNPCPPPVRQIKQYQFAIEPMKGEDQIKEVEMPKNCQEPNEITDNKLAYMTYSDNYKMENDNILIFAKKSGREDDGMETKCNSGGKATTTKENNVTSNEDEDYKPKCNEDPCKQMSHSGDVAKAPPAKKKCQSDEIKLKRDLCKRDKIKQGPSKIYTKRENPCVRKKHPLKKAKSLTNNSKKENPCEDRKQKDSFKKNKQSEHLCGNKQEKNPNANNKSKKNPCKNEKLNEDPCRIKESSFGISKQKNNSTEKEIQNEDLCKKKDSIGSSIHKEDPCKKQDHSKKNPCADKSSCKRDELKEDHCRKKESVGSSKQKGDANKKEVQEENPCKKKKLSGNSKQKEDPCKRHKQRDNPCQKERKNDSSKKKNSCEGIQKQDPCRDKKSIKKEKADPCQGTNTSNHKSNQETQANNKNKQQKSAACGSQKRETKPNCGKNEKLFSTLAKTSSSSNIFKRTFVSMPSLRIKNIYNYAFMRHLSSKRDGKNKKKLDNLARGSQCKAVGVYAPPHRKPAYNPHPKEGLRQCYPTYDMDCKKLCKDTRVTNCKKLAFLKDTDDNKRTNTK